MKQLVFVTLISAVLSGVLLLPAFSEGDSLDAKVTPLVLSVNITQTEVQYGSLPLSTDDTNRSTDGSANLTVTNTGSVLADLLIRGSDAVPAVGDTTWTLNCSPATVGTVGPNQFVHRFVRLPGDFNSAEALCSASDKILVEDIAALTGSIEFRLQMNMPTASTGYSERTSNVIVTAVQP